MIYFPCHYFGAKLLPLDDALVHEHFFQHLYALLNLLFRMRGHQRETNQRVLRRTGWRYHGIDEHTVVKSQLGHHEGLVDVSHVQRDDGTLGLTNLEALFPESLQGVAGNLPKALYALRLILDDVQGLARGSRGGRRVRGAEDVSAAGMAQIVDGCLLYTSPSPRD